MRKTCIILLSTVLFSSCQKSYCWKCTLTQITSSNTPGVGGVNHSTTQLCDKTGKQITEYQKASSTKATSTVGGITVTVTNFMNCDRQ